MVTPGGRRRRAGRAAARTAGPPGQRRRAAARRPARPARGSRPRPAGGTRHRPVEAACRSSACRAAARRSASFARGLSERCASSWASAAWLVSSSTVPASAGSASSSHPNGPSHADSSPSSSDGRPPGPPAAALARPGGEQHVAHPGQLHPARDRCQQPGSLPAGQRQPTRARRQGEHVLAVVAGRGQARPGSDHPHRAARLFPHPADRDRRSPAPRRGQLRRPLRRPVTGARSAARRHGLRGAGDLGQLPGGQRRQDLPWLLSRDHRAPRIIRPAECCPHANKYGSAAEAVHREQ